MFFNFRYRRYSALKNSDRFVVWSKNTHLFYDFLNTYITCEYLFRDDYFAELWLRL